MEIQEAHGKKGTARRTTYLRDNSLDIIRHYTSDSPTGLTSGDYPGKDTERYHKNIEIHWIDFNQNSPTCL